MSGPSKHLTWKELACKDGTPYPEEFIKDGRVYTLSNVFESLREHFGGKPIEILSAYRSAEHNRKVGGARNSQHVQGRALDLRPPKGYTLEQFYKEILWLAKNKLHDIKGIGKYKTFIHIDVRPTNTLAHWSGAGMKDALS